MSTSNSREDGVPAAPAGEYQLGRRPAPPPVVVLVGGATGDQSKIAELVNGGCLVVLACDSQVVRQWLPETLGLRAEKGAPHVLFRVDRLEVDLTERRVRWLDRVVHLTDHEFQILASLARDPGRTWSFLELVESVWGRRFYADASTVHSAVKRLRRKLRGCGVKVSIESVRGVGFRLDGPADDQPPSA